MMKMAWLVRLFEDDEEVLYSSEPNYCYSKRRIVYMEVEE